MRTYHHLILVGAFVMLLFGCLLGSVFHWDFYETEENRQLASLPDVKQTAIADWPKAYETYFNDHFGVRNTFIRRHRKIMRKIEKSNQVIYGNDGWLFFNAEIIIKDYLGQKNPDQQKINRIETSLQSRINWLTQRNIQFLFVWAPNKITLYPEHLPEQLISLRGKTTRECLIEAFDDLFQTHMVDLIPTLTKAKQEGDLYLKNNTHWNDRGAHIAHKAIIESLRNRLPNLPETLNYEDLEIRVEPVKGDLSQMSGTPEKYVVLSEKLINPLRSGWITNALTNAVLLTPEHMPLDKKPPSYTTQTVPVICWFFMIRLPRDFRNFFRIILKTQPISGDTLLLNCCRWPSLYSCFCSRSCSWPREPSIRSFISDSNALHTICLRS